MANGYSTDATGYTRALETGDARFSAEDVTPDYRDRSIQAFVQSDTTGHILPRVELHSGDSMTREDDIPELVQTLERLNQSGHQDISGRQDDLSVFSFARAIGFINNAQRKAEGLPPQDFSEMSIEDQLRLSVTPEQAQKVARVMDDYFKQRGTSLAEMSSKDANYRAIELLAMNGFGGRLKGENGEVRLADIVKASVQDGNWRDFSSGDMMKVFYE